MLGKECFLANVANHKIQVVNDDGVNRHIIMSSGSFNMKYHVTTWPWYLCFSGDMGCFVFSRLEDNFDFFRQDKLTINPGYWHEKLTAIDSCDGSRQYSPALFADAVKQHFDDNFSIADDATKAVVWKQIRDDVISWSDDGYDRAITAASNFSSGDGFCFENFYPDCMEYTFRYIWCLYAIVYTISEYDALKNAESPLTQAMGE